ncbi:MAG: PilT protein domain protein [Chthoniobacteraceae bacterium]|nr:PilT protein domain protein [Chthoniobacteraceae bacterium]
MPPQFTINLLRALFVTFATCVGLMVGEQAFGSAFSGGALGGIFGLGIVLGDRLLKGISLRLFSSATFGLFIGFIFAQLLLASHFLRGSSEDAQWIAGLMVYATCAYVGMMLAIRSSRDEFALVVPYIRFRRATVQDEPVLIDTNIIIDGQIVELCATGFLSSSLIVARCVLDELQRMADSADPLKRDRGRAALLRLQQMQSNPALSITIHETDSDGDLSVDTRLANLAKLLDVRLLTNDGNLCSIARLQGVTALNINELTRALRPTIAAGQHLELALVKEGREPHQAVGYLADGTMIIVNHARAFLGKTASIVIASAHQTSAGRLFFAELR